MATTPLFTTQPNFGGVVTAPVNIPVEVSCGPWKGIGITLIVLAVISIIVFIILLATNNIHFGKPSTTVPTHDQLIAALRTGINVTSSDPASRSDFSTLVKLGGENSPGINMAITSSMKVNGVTVPDIGGDAIAYNLLPGANPGVFVSINDSAPTSTRKRVQVDSKMQVTTTPVTVTVVGATRR